MKPSTFARISIHAPAEGATASGMPKSMHLIIFQSTLPRRERPELYRDGGEMHENFNPRSRGGSDKRVEAIPDKEYRISIHAPAEGATKTWTLGFICGEFQSTLPRRERQNSKEISVFLGLFQSTLPRRERPVTCQIKSAAEEFQSTLPRRERRRQGNRKSL